MDGWMDGRTYGRPNSLMSDGRLDGWIDRKMNR